MKRTFTRTTKENPNDTHTWHDERSLIDCLDEIITEFDWGARTEWLPDGTFSMRATVFGATDVTTFMGSESEMATIHQFVLARGKVSQLLCQLMNIPYIHKQYYRNELIIAYGLFLADPEAVDDWSSLLTPTLTVETYSLDTITHRIADVHKVKDTFKDLEPSDGVFSILASYPLAI